MDTSHAGRREREGGQNVVVGLRVEGKRLFSTSSILTESVAWTPLSSSSLPKPQSILFLRDSSRSFPSFRLRSSDGKVIVYHGLSNIFPSCGPPWTLGPIMAQDTLHPSQRQQPSHLTEASMHPSEPSCQSVHTQAQLIMVTKSQAVASRE